MCSYCTCLWFQWHIMEMQNSAFFPSYVLCGAYNINILFIPDFHCLNLIFFSLFLSQSLFCIPVFFLKFFRNCQKPKLILVFDSNTWKSFLPRSSASKYRSSCTMFTLGVWLSSLASPFVLIIRITWEVWNHLVISYNKLKKSVTVEKCFKVFYYKIETSLIPRRI